MNVNICQNGARTDVEQLWHWHFGHGMPHVDLAEEHLDQGLTIHLILPTDEWKEGRRSRLQSCPVACPLSCSSSARFDLSGHPFQLAADFHVAVRFGSPTGGTTNYVTVSGQDLSLSLSISLSHVICKLLFGCLNRQMVCLLGITLSQATSMAAPIAPPAAPPAPLAASAFGHVKHCPTT